MPHEQVTKSRYDREYLILPLSPFKTLSNHSTDRAFSYYLLFIYSRLSFSIFPFFTTYLPSFHTSLVLCYCPPLKDLLPAPTFAQFSLQASKQAST